MALAQEKKGGPYTKNEREKRQKEVHRLYFEFGYSATKIADLMKINRNTINADIKFWYSNIREDIKQDSEDFILKQIGRLEAQRTRIVESIAENKDEDVRLEKLLLDIDSKISNLVLRINSENQMVGSVEISEEEIRDFVLFLLVKYNKDYRLGRKEIEAGIINFYQCNAVDAAKIFSKLNELGLESCKKSGTAKLVYDLLEFAYLRKYLSPNDEFVVKINSLCILGSHLEAEIIRVERRFDERYGSKERWTDEYFERYDEEKRKVIEESAETSSKIIYEALDEISNHDRIKEAIKCINVFFGKEEIKERFPEL